MFVEAPRDGLSRKLEVVIPRCGSQNDAISVNEPPLSTSLGDIEAVERLAALQQG